MLKNILLSAIIVLSLFPVFAQSQPQPVRVAVAANARFVLKKLSEDFQRKTGITVEVISGSSGKLASQIKNGAPYDIFLSADMEFAQSLYTEGFALDKPKVYAVGCLIVCSTTGADIKNWKNLISKQVPGKIAIGNPKIAPYGKAAEEAMNHFNLYQAASDRLVFAESINQVNTYVLKGAVSFGFTTASLVYELEPSAGLKWQKIDPKAYSPIQQGAVLLKFAKNKNFTNNKRFFDYLFSAGAKAIFKRFGYTTV